MKSLNGKRIAAVAAGAALLGLGLAFAGPVSFQNVPIISNSGQPVVQVVIGSTAKPSDGAAAANIAAAIGNLAYTSVPVTATVNQTQAAQVLHAVLPSNAGYSLSNVGVYLNESSTAYVSGTYSFSTLIGSVLNRAVKMSSPIATKTLQTGSTNGYAYPESTSLSSSPTSSAYSAASFVPFSSVSGNTNGGGVSFTSGFTSSSYDNILRVTHSDLGSLMSNAGAYGENEYLWLTGFPVYDQASSVNQFALLSAGGAYQVTFSKPIAQKTSSNSINNAEFTLLGENWTIINSTLPSTQASSTTAVNGGSLELASSLSPLTTLYVGQNVTSGAFKVMLTDLGQPNSNGVSPAGLNIYYNNQLTNVTAISPNDTTQKFNVTGHNLYIKVKSTFAGLYAYQKYAKIQLYANVYNITDGKVFNQTNNPGWNVNLLWTNGTSGNTPNMLQSIVIYNTSPTTLTSGQSFSFITSPAMYKLTFVGETLSSANFDPVTASLSTTGSIAYENTPVGNVAGNINNITEPAQLFKVSSGISNAFNYAGQTGSSVLYDLTPYQLVETANAVPAQSANIVLSVTNSTLVSPSNPLVVTIKGANSANGIVSTSYSFTSASGSNVPGTAFKNITSITLSRAIPQLGTVVTVFGSNSATQFATLNGIAPQILYSQSGKNYDLTTSAGNVIYNQQNGQPTTSFALTSNSFAPGTGSHQYFTYTMNEIAVPSQSSSQDSLAFGIYNSTTGIAASPFFQLNQSATGTRNNMTYTSTTGTSLNAPAGFRTERGSKVASISPGSVTVDFAKSVDNLQFAVGPSNVTAVTSTQKTFGPYGIGQSTNIPNVSIANVTAKITVGSASGATVSGISNLTATPSVSVATTPVLLKNLPTSPLVVLDSGANPSSNLILIGSGYVNTLSQQLETSQGVSITPTSAPIVQAYGTDRVLIAGYSANQTTDAANTFIQDLYAAASTT
jgi:hypothetical protein